MLEQLNKALAFQNCIEEVFKNDITDVALQLSIVCTTIDAIASNNDLNIRELIEDIKSSVLAVNNELGKYHEED